MLPTRGRPAAGLWILISALWLAACGGTAPIAHPTGARDVMIRQSGTSGGMVPSRLDNLAGQFPPFTLFGDGRLVYSKDGGLYQAHLDEAAIQKLLALAVNDVRFFDLGPFVGPQCCDMPGSQLSITAAGQTKNVSMSILDANGADADSVRRLQRLLAALAALRTGTDPVYTPTGVTLYAEAVRGEVAANTPAWSAPQVSLAAARAATSAGPGLPLTGEAAQAARRAEQGGPIFLENGAGYRVLVVPAAP